VNPSTGETYATSSLSDPADVDEAMRAVRTAFEDGWRDTTPGERMGYLLKMADAIDRNADRLVEIEAREHLEAQGADPVPGPRSPPSARRRPRIYGAFL